MNSTNEKLKFYQKKRNLFLFFWLAILVFIFGGLFVSYTWDDSLVWTIYLILLLVALFLFIGLRSRFVFYDMYYHYFRMINDNQGLLVPQFQPYTQNWLNQFATSPYSLLLNHPSFLIYYRFVDKTTSFIKSRNILLIVIIAKNTEVDFHQDEIENQIKSLYLNQAGKRYHHQITITFKKYPSFNDSCKEECDRIINFRAQRSHLIQLNVGYFSDLKQAYFLRPKTKYPSKFYYYACMQADSMIKGGLYERQRRQQTSKTR